MYRNQYVTNFLSDFVKWICPIFYNVSSVIYEYLVPSKISKYYQREWLCYYYVI